MGHIKVHAALDTVDNKLVDPIQGFDTFVSYVDDDGNLHPLPCCKVEVVIEAGRAVGLIRVTTGTFELDLPNLAAEIVRDETAKADGTFDALRGPHLSGSVHVHTKVED